MVAGPGVAPGTEDYETSVILFYYPAIDIYANTMCRIYYFNMERNARIELTTEGWKPTVLPLN